MVIDYSSVGGNSVKPKKTVFITVIIVITKKGKCNYKKDFL